jgi:hypothetical protein
VVSYDRTILPGGEGTINLTVHTKGFEGALHKTAEVETNDPLKNRFTLGVRAFVQIPISVTPRFVLLAGNADQEVSTSIKITAGLDKPLFIEPEAFSLQGKLRYEIEEIENGRSYLVRFITIPGNPENLRGFLNLKTNYEEKPVLNIRVMARLR